MLAPTLDIFKIHPMKKCRKILLGQPYSSNFFFIFDTISQRKFYHI